MNTNDTMNALIRGARGQDPKPTQPGTSPVVEQDQDQPPAIPSGHAGAGTQAPPRAALDMNTLIRRAAGRG